MAPEVYRGEKYDEKCDVFSFGVILGVLVRGTKMPQRSRANGFSFKMEQLKGQIPASCPHAFGSLFLQCCSATPEERPSFKGALEVLKRLGDELKKTERDKIVITSTTDHSSEEDQNCIDIRGPDELGWDEKDEEKEEDVVEVGSEVRERKEMDNNSGNHKGKGKEKEKKDKEEKQKQEEEERKERERKEKEEKEIKDKEEKEKKERKEVAEAKKKEIVQQQQPQHPQQLQQDSPKTPPTVVVEKPKGDGKEVPTKNKTEGEKDKKKEGGFDGTASLKKILQKEEMRLNNRRGGPPTKYNSVKKK